VNDYRVGNETAKDEAWICKENQYVNWVLSLLLSRSSLQNLYYPRSLGIRQQSCKSKSQQWIKAIYPSILWMMCAVLISVIICSSMADGWFGSNWNLWSNQFFNCS
jgi:hypothetical protein